MAGGIRLFKDKLKNNGKFARIMFVLIALFFSLYIFVFCAFGSRPKLFLISYPVLGLLIISIGIYGFAYFEDLKKQLSWKLLIPFIFVIFVFLTTLIGTRNFAYFKTTFLLTLTCYAALAAYICLKNLKLILYLIAAPIFAFSAYYLIHYFPILLHYSGQRLGSFFGNENDVGLNLYFGFVFATLLVFLYKQYWMSPIALITLFAGITTGSKKVIILSFCFLLFLVCVLLRKKKILLIVGLASLVTISIVILSLPAFYDIRKRLITGIPFFGNLDADASTVNRLLFFETSFYLGTKSMLFGYGGGAFASLSGFGAYSHNNLGEILCDFGICGVFSFYFLYPFIGFFVDKKNIKHLLIVFTFLGTFVFCSFTAIFFDSKIYYIFLALCLYIIDDNTKLVLRKHESANIYCEITI